MFVAFFFLPSSAVEAMLSYVKPSPVSADRRGESILSVVRRPLAGRRPDQADVDFQHLNPR
jgi:hypothetical protein